MRWQDLAPKISASLRDPGSPGGWCGALAGSWRRRRHRPQGGQKHKEAGKLAGGDRGSNRSMITDAGETSN